MQFPYIENTYKEVNIEDLKSPIYDTIQNLITSHFSKVVSKDKYSIYLNFDMINDLNISFRIDIYTIGESGRDEYCSMFNLIGDELYVIGAKFTDGVVIKTYSVGGGFKTLNQNRDGKLNVLRNEYELGDYKKPDFGNPIHYEYIDITFTLNSDVKIKK